MVNWLKLIFRKISKFQIPKVAIMWQELRKNCKIRCRTELGI